MARMDTTLCYLYLLTTSKTKKKYIGITNNPNGRLEGHKKCARDGDKRPLYKAMRNYGVKSFNMSILCSGPRWALSNIEAAMIRYWKTKAPAGYNLAPGGE
jgi:predicted GIY-YIG superfamily endonuclease